MRKPLRQRRFTFNSEELFEYLKELEEYGLIQIENVRFLRAQLESDEKKA